MSKKNFALDGAGQGDSDAGKNLMSESKRKKLKSEQQQQAKTIEEQQKYEKLTIDEHIARIGNNWEAIEDRVVIFPDTPAVVSKGGLFLPAASIAKPHRGTIICMGPGEINKTERMKAISVGDRAIYGRFAGTDVEIDGQLYTIVRITDIILREKKKVKSE